MIRDERPWVAVGLGASAGLAVVVSPVLTPALVAALVAVGVAVTRPTLLVVAVFVGILIDRIGLTGMEVDEFPVTASKLTVGGALGLWVVHALLTGARLWRGHPVLTALFGFVLSTGLSIVMVGTLKAGKFALFGVLMTTILAGLAYTILAEAPLEGIYRWIAGGLIVTLGLSLTGIGGSAESGRASGTMGDPNEWATVVLLVTPFALGGLARDPRPIARVLRLGLVLLAPVGLLQAGSRSALLVGVLVAPVCLWMLWHRRGELAVGVALAAVVAPFAADLELARRRIEGLVGNLRGSAVVEDASLDERSELLRQGLDLFTEHWLLGVGPGRFAAATGFVSESGRLRPAHNTWLEIASEQGVLGLLAVAGFVGAVVWTVGTAWRRASTVDARTRLAGAAAGLASLALMASTLGLMTFSIGYLVLGCTLAVAHQVKDGRPGG